MIIGNILIVEDDPINAESMKDTLEDVNYNVVLVVNAEQAKSIVKSQTFDLVMLDVWMVGQDGISLLEEWTNARFATPVVMMSGHAEHQDVIKAIKLGAVDFFQKPLHNILPLVRKVLSENNSNKQKVGYIDFELPLKTVKNIVEQQYFNYHLDRNNHNIAKVAKLAGLERATLYRKLKDLGIEKQ